MITTSWDPPLTRAELEGRASPEFANQPEVVPWQLYDTFSIANGGTGPYPLYQALNPDKTLCNMEGPGQLPDPQFLIIDYAAADYLITPAIGDATTVPPAWADLSNILYTCRATFEFNMSNKRYGPFSLSMCAPTGAVEGQAYGFGTAASGATAGLVAGGRSGSGGFPFCGAIVIPPKIGFDVTVRLATAATLTATRQVRFSLVGPLYRRVL